LWKVAGGKPTLKIPSNVTLKMDDNIRILVAGTPTYGVNGYTDGAIINSDQIGGNENINIIGGSFKAAGPTDGAVFIAFKKLNKGKIHTTFLDNNGSTRGQISYSKNIDININVHYENGPWTKVIQTNQAGGTMYSFEDGFRIGSGSSNIKIQGNIHSGDDAIALSNEPAENNNSVNGADIENVTIGPVVASTKAGNVLRILHSNFSPFSPMLSGEIRNVTVNDFIGNPTSSGDGASGISITDYSGRRANKNISLNNVQINTNNVNGNNSSSIAVINSDNVKLNNVTIDSANSMYGLNLSDVTNSIFTNLTLKASSSNIDGIIVGNSSKLKFANNTIASATRYGIHLLNSDYIDVKSNNINGSLVENLHTSNTTHLSVSSNVYTNATSTSPNSLAASSMDNFEVLGDIRIGTSGTNGCLQRFDGTALTGTCSSDENLKTNIKTLDNADIATKLGNIDIVEYNWNETANKEYSKATNTKAIGITAQNIEEVFPELVSTDDKGYKVVDITTLQWYVMAAVKQLIDTISKMAEEVVTNVIKSKTLCLTDNDGETCINRSQLNNVLSNTGTSNNFAPVTNWTAPQLDTSSTTEPESIVSPEVTTTDVTSSTTIEEITIVDSVASSTGE
jgi:parallel beta-helix repeat protein